MRKSISYYLVLAVLKIKGVKKIFSTDPIDYKKLRKEDIKEPKGSAYKKANTFSVFNSRITEIKTSKKSDKLILFVHGGAFVSGPVQHHWEAVKKMHKKTDFTVWLCDYPKAPESKINEISENIDAVYDKALETYEAKNILLLGDSVGATLIFALVQRLIKKGNKTPSKIIAITPVMDASLSNSEIKEVDKKDPILSKLGVLSAKKMCAENEDLTAPNISPIHGSFNHFPETLLFLAEHDIMYPDQQILIEKLKESNIKFKAIIGKQMPHIWVLLPFFKEGKKAMKLLLNEIN